ncbi:ring finger protein 25 [Echinococcus multilocularis]|uniref:Ring finger protein 25 n=1 Tax=Echinococcus multilocularis TaxID=6211 RepID=A0A068YFK2_ECHMU|nr:ring finger protein 25 [Echinococcus multilocularis]
MNGHAVLRCRSRTLVRQWRLIVPVATPLLVASLCLSPGFITVSYKACLALLCIKKIWKMRLLLLSLPFRISQTRFCSLRLPFQLKPLYAQGVCEIPVNVLLSLDVFCPSEYPLLPPAVKVVGTVGLSDSALSKLQSNIAAVIDSCQKDHVIFPLIECCRDFISSNVPSVDCSICFDAFQTEDQVYRSRCNHFFHKECLVGYHNNLLNTHKNQIAALLVKNPYCPRDMRPQLKFPCPVCKTELPSMVDIPESYI